MFKFIALRLKILKKIMPYANGVKRHYSIITALSLVNMQIGLLSPLLYKVLVDDVIIGRHLSKVFLVIGGYVFIYILNFSISVVMNYSSNKFFNRLLFKIRLKIWRNYIQMPVKQYDSFTTSDLKLRLDDDIEKISDFVNGQTYSYVISALSVIVYTVILFVLSWQLALLSIAILPVSFYLGKLFAKKEYALSKIRRTIWNNRENRILSSLHAWKEIKALNLKKDFYRFFTKNIHDYALLEARWLVIQNLYNNIIPMLKDDLLIKLSMYFVGGLLVMQGHFTVGTLLVFIQYYNNFSGNINSFIGSNISLSSNLLSYEKIIEVVDESEKQKNEKLYTGNLKGDIRFKDVSFQYAEKLGNVLNNIDIEIKQGEKIAIVGKSGAGKSTFIKLLLNIVDSTGGQVLVDGRDIRGIGSYRLHKSIGVVMQDSILFNLSISDNLRLARYNANRADVRNACHNARLDDFVDSLPENYDTLIGEKGVKLSGGQKQRMAIARVFLSNPGIIIFDEATSSLDYESEKFIHRAIKELGENKTIIIIAHRLSSVMLADRVVVLKDGCIAGTGHHSELLNRNEAYDELFKEQYMDVE